MKKFIFFICLILQACSGEENTKIDELYYNKVDGLFYKINENKPFSGTAFKIIDDNIKITIWNYKDGKNDGVCKNFYENGNIKFYGEFKEGVPNGVIREYNKEGVLVLEENFKNGVLNGEKKEFYENGNIKTLETYKNDFLHGNRATYYESGKEKVIEKYENDELVESVFKQNL